MKRAVFFAIIAAVLLVPGAVVYTYGTVSAANIESTVQPADPASIPTMHVFGNAIGSVSAGDLFLIDTSGEDADIALMLLMTNIDELIRNYRYMTIKIGVYIQTNDNKWEKLVIFSGEATPDIYVTMQNGSVSLTIPAKGKYKVSIEGGCFQSYSIAPGEEVAIPQFCLTSA